MRKLSPHAQKIIADVYLVGSVEADPPLVLRDLARSVRIVGQMLDGLADRYSVPGKGLARVVTIAGSMLWGMVELAVPGSFWWKISRNWYALIALSGVVIIALGLVTNTAGMASIGVELIFAVFVLRLLVSVLWGYMNTGSLCVRCLKLLAVIVIAVVGGGLLGYLLVLHSQGIGAGLKWLGDRFINLRGNIPKVLRPQP